MTARAWIPVFATCLLLSGCGDGAEERSAEAWTRIADTAFHHGDDIVYEARSSSDFDSEELQAKRTDAVVAYRKAVLAYLGAFRMEDPVEERRAARAMLAFRIGRSYAKVAGYAELERRREYGADHALFWFREALALRPELHQVWYERAELQDSDIEQVRNPVRALESYRRYLASFENDGAISEAEKPRVAHARKRVDELSKVTAPKDG